MPAAKTPVLMYLNSGDGVKTSSSPKSGVSRWKTTLFPLALLCVHFSLRSCHICPCQYGQDICGTFKAEIPAFNLPVGLGTLFFFASKNAQNPGHCEILADGSNFRF